MINQHHQAGRVLLASIVATALLATAGVLSATAFFTASTRPRAQDPRLDISSTALTTAEELGKAFATVSDHVKPAVVSIFSEKTVKVPAVDWSAPFSNDFLQRFLGQRRPLHPGSLEQREHGVPQRGMGSGMIIDKAGLVLTNNHVVNQVDEIKVQLADGRTFGARVVGADRPSDIAVIQMKDAPPDLPVAEFGDSDAARVGDLVVAIGSPFGYAQTVTSGIISAKGRSAVGINAYEDYLQTDAAISPGNSGGPLVDMHGFVVGVNSAIAGNFGQSSGVGFAIPVNMIKSILPTLEKGEAVTRGVLGVVIQPLTGDLAKQFGIKPAKGVLVAGVSPDSSASRAGMKPGDVILRFDDRDVGDVARLRNMVAGTAPGSVVKVEIVRDGKNETLPVTVAKLEAEGVAARVAEPAVGDAVAKLGCAVQTVTPELAQEYGLGTAKGAIVTEVREGSPASIAGIEQGDLIVEANRKPVSSAEDLKAAVSSDEPLANGVLLRIKRKDSTMFVVLKMAPKAA